MSPSRRFRITLVLFVLAAFTAFYWFDLGQYLNLESLKTQQSLLTSYFDTHPLGFSLIYASIYVASAALSIPGATILTLASGAIFGFWWGLLLVSLSSSIGATLAFLGSRYLLRDTVQKKFKDKLEKVNAGIEKEGSFYLFTLRLVPLIPFFVINLVMGLTPMKTRTFFFVSQLGMLMGTIVYVNAGTQLANITSPRDILTPSLLFSFVLIGILPLISKWLLNRFKAGQHMKKFKKPKTFEQNMVVIGGGSAGLISAYIAAALKAKVVLIEKDKMGGDCLNTGCVPSKALIRSAKIFHQIKKAQEFGLEVSSAKVDFAKVMARVQNIISTIAPHDSQERYRGLGVECITGEARIISPYTVQVNDKIITTKNIVIATGAGPLIPPIPGLDTIPFLTSENIWSLKELPENLLVLGGGAIGCELAQSFSRLGSKVSLVEMSPRIMAKEDREVSTLIAQEFEKEGVQVFTSHKALSIEASVENSTQALVCETDGREVRIPFSHILVALGRKARVKGFGLEEMGVELAKNGTVAANEFLQTTNFPNIYACGDATGPFQFTHTASYQAWYVAVNSLFSPLKKFAVDYRVIPWCTYTDPEVARVGLSEQEAKEKGIPYQVARYEFSDLDRSITEGDTLGFVKILTPPKGDKILGVTIVGNHAGDLMAEYVAAMKHGLGMNKVLGTIHIYPTLAEANKNVAGVWKRQNAPQAILKFLEKFHAWRRS